MPRTPPSRTSRLLPRPSAVSGSSGGNWRTKAREIVAIGRHVDAVAGPAAAPARVARERRVARQRAAQRRERLRLAHHHAAAPSPSTPGTCPIEPAPIVTTTSPSRTSGADRRRQLGDRFDEHRLDLAGDAHRARERAAVGGDDRRLAGRIDVGQHAARRRSTAPARSPRTDRACACSDAAGTRARAAGRESCRAPRRSSPPSRPDGGRSRRSA